MPKTEIPKAYEAKLYEDEIYAAWEKSGFFNPDNLSGEPYSIMMPPPNVTGVLHLGHALENSLMDAMARFQRLNGKKVLLVPGTDHAALPTQAKVEKILMDGGMKNPRKELGREKLVEKIREFAEDSRATILSQVKKMGTSCDWSRLAYTFDEKRNVAVVELFKRMYEDGLIYKGSRVVNWSTKGQSTCSDDEIVYIERPSVLYTFKYSKDFPITIATTRPETKLGDSAVAVHPTDERYQQYIGQTFVVDIGAAKPLNIKIIADENVDPTFGTGALGVTPAHSPVDFLMYEKQKAAGNPIELIQVIGEDGNMTLAAGKYAGLTVEAAREQFVGWLEAEGLLTKTPEDIVQNVGTSDRFKDVIESLPMTQWWLDVQKMIPSKGKSLRDLMREALTTGLNGDATQKVTVTPDRFTKLYLNRVESLRDWCLSRQTWWGHRIPVWYCIGCGNTRVNPQIKGHWSFVRHGETAWNKEDKPIGHTDHPLNTTGEEQARTASTYFQSKKIDLIISSDLQRAKQTADIISKEIGGVEVICEKAFQERSLGDLEGMTRPEITEKFGSTHVYDLVLPNGESYEQVEKRAWDAFVLHQDKHLSKNVIVVSHGGTLLMLLKKMKQWTPDQSMAFGTFKNAEVLEFDVADPCEKCGGHFFEQDPDTLDTWFSSGSWTFSTLGWPEQTIDLKTFHPTNWMQMGSEILYLWLMRMVLMSTYALNEIPFKDAYIHGVLRNEEGKKYSKSDANGIDPIDVMNEYGCDALRVSVISGTTPGNDSRFTKEKIESSRNFVNKLWNISRFILTSIDERPSLDDVKAVTLSDKWILGRLESTANNVSKLIEQFDFALAIEALREFVWTDFADWYLEIAKTQQANGETKESTNKILLFVLRNILILCHPFMPFVTEVIWKEIGEGFLLVASWPKVSGFIEEETESRFELLKTLVVGIRNVRSQNKIEPKQLINIVFVAPDESRSFIESHRAVIAMLARTNPEFEIVRERAIEVLEVSFMEKNIIVIVKLASVLDPEKEKVRIEKETAQLKSYIESTQDKLTNEEFRSKAPEKIIAQMEEKLREAKEKLDALKK